MTTFVSSLVTRTKVLVRKQASGFLRVPAAIHDCHHPSLLRKTATTRFISSSSSSLSSARITPTLTEITLKCSDGITLAGQQWTTTSSATHNNTTKDNSPEEATRKTTTTTTTTAKNILCLHGWLDNCRSFYHVAPGILKHIMLTKNTTNNDTDTWNTTTTTNIVALDFPGHGLSSHKSRDGPSILNYTDSAYYMIEAIERLGWWNDQEDDVPNNNKNLQPATPDNNTTTHTTNKNNKPITLIGHSFGAAVACVIAACFPERVDKLILLDAAGPLERPLSNLPKYMRNSIQARKRGNSVVDAAAGGGGGDTPTTGTYNNNEKEVIEAAIKERQQIMLRASPDKTQYVSEEVVKELILRDRIVPQHHGHNSNHIHFRYDKRLHWPSFDSSLYTVEQIESLYKNIKCPTCILIAEDGWPLKKESKQKRLKEIFLLQDKQETIKQSVKTKNVMKMLPGSHHFHANPDTSHDVVNEIIDFLLQA